MRRLLQGDVGSGKTVVAACTALMALESGFDVALMAPTEILAGQHFRNFTRWFEPLGVRVELRTGNRKSVERTRLDLPATRPPSPVTLTIGTHALIQEGFRQCRVRDYGELARIELAVEELPNVLAAGRRERLVEILKGLGYRFVTLDLEGYRQGGVTLTPPA